MKFCASDIRPARKGVYNSNHMVGSKLMLSHGLGLGTIRKGGSSPGPDLCQVPRQKFPIADDCKLALRATCQGSLFFFMAQKSLGLSLLFRTPGAMQGVEAPSPS